MERNVAIKVENLYKNFKIPHEKHTSLKSATLNLFKRRKYSIHKAAEGISFEVKKGEFFGIIGKNGCGKSTLLKMLAGIYVPDKGKITINGRLSPFLELGVGFNPDLTARDNIYLNGTILGLSRKEIDEKIGEIIAFSELEEFIDQKLKNFSSGMQVRLAFSVAIQAHADILLIDEVLAVGDAAFQQKCFNIFRDLKKKGKTIVFVSHGMDSIEEFCDRVMLIDEAKVADIGEAKRVIYSYKTLDLKQKKSDKQEERSDRRWGNKKIEIVSLSLQNEKGEESKVFKTESIIRGKFGFRVRDKKVVDASRFCVVDIGLYDVRGNLTINDQRRLNPGDFKKKEIEFAFEIPELQENKYYFSLSIRNAKNGEVYDERNKDYEIYVASRITGLGLISTPSFWYPKINILGMLRIRNEEEIIQDTLDHMSQFVDKIIVFDDASTDKTLDIVYKHPRVIEVIENKTWKQNRIQEETANRHQLLKRAQKFNPNWIFYADADERFEGNIKEFLNSKEAENVDAIRIRLFDAYMTKNDKAAYKKGQKLLGFRKFFGPERRDIIMIWRNHPDVKYEGSDQREPIIKGNVITKFYCQHYGKSLSEKHWEETCDYYAKYFPKHYSEKWKNRRGKAIHQESDFGTPLYTWKEVKKNGIQIHPELSGKEAK